MLTDAEIRKKKPQATPYKLGDGRGLYLLVLPSGAKSWRYDYRLRGRRKTITLGLYPDVTLEKARTRLQDARRLVSEGQDPSTARRLAKGRTQADTTFAAVGRAWWAWRKPKLGKRASARNVYLLDVLITAVGRWRIGELTPTQILEALDAITSPVQARRAKQVCSQVFRYAVARGWALRDVTADLRGALAPTKTVRHHPAITDPAKVGALLRAIDGLDGSPIVRAALQLAPLVFVRPGELRTAEWKDLDLPAKLWRIPAAKMKMAEPHLVPLSAQSVAILEALKPLTGKGRWVFPTVRSPVRPMSDGTLNAALRRLGYAGDEMTAHGFRAMARTLLAEQLHADPYVIESQLAHAAPGPLGRAYDRARYLPQRAKLLADWANYLDTLRAG